MAEPAPGLGPDFKKTRNRRNLVVALSLVGFVILVFLITLAKMKAGG